MFSCKIRFQPKMTIVAPLLFFLGMMFFGWLLYAINHWGWLTRNQTNFASIIGFFLFLGLSLFLGFAGGEIKVEGSKLRIIRKVFSHIEISLVETKGTLLSWRTLNRHLGWGLNGKQLVLNSGIEHIVIGTLDAKGAEGLHNSQAFLFDLPVAAIAPEDFQRLIGFLEGMVQIQK